MRKLLVLAILLSGCDDLELGVAFFTDHGSVYECKTTAVDTLELCTDLSERELEMSTGWPCEPTSRLWPALTGCIYGCYPHSGCNAHHGCYCPEGGTSTSSHLPLDHRSDQRHRARHAEENQTDLFRRR